MTDVIDLLNDAAPTADDLVYVVNDPLGTPGDRKVTLQNLATALAGMSGGAYVDLVNAQTVGGVKTFTSDPIIPDEAYGVGWNGVLEPPTKNAVYDAVSGLPTLDTATPASLNVYTAANITYVDFIGAASSSVFQDSVFRVQDNGDATKQFALDLGLATTGTTMTLRASQAASRVLVLPDTDGTLLATTLSQTVTGLKTFEGLTAYTSPSPRGIGLGNINDRSRNAMVELYGYAAPIQAILGFMHAGGGVGTETQTPTSSNIGTVAARGYNNAGAYTSANQGLLRWTTTEAVTDASRGVLFSLFVTPTGTGSNAEGLRVSANNPAQVMARGALVAGAGGSFVAAAAGIGLKVTGGVQLVAAAVTMVDGNNNHDVEITAPIMVVQGPTAAFGFSGFVNPGGVAPQNGQRIVILSRLGLAMTALNEDAGSTAAYRLLTLTGASQTTTTDGLFIFVYDGVSATPRWVKEGIAT